MTFTEQSGKASSSRLVSKHLQVEFARSHMCALIIMICFLHWTIHFTSIQPIQRFSTLRSVHTTPLLHCVALLHAHSCDVICNGMSHKSSIYLNLKCSAAAVTCDIDVIDILAPQPNFGVVWTDLKPFICNAYTVLYIHLG